MILIALCPVGFEKTLSLEIKKLALNSGILYRIIDLSYGKLRFETDIKGLYYALIGLRTADRILLQCASSVVHDFDDLFELAHNIPFEDYIPKNMPLIIEKVRTNRSSLSAKTSIQSVAHKAIASRLCTKYGLRRLAENGIPAALRIYIEKDKAEILLDLCGDPLYKRGYRTEGGIAPLRETIAAAALLSSGWKRKYPLYDPFCGSGTIAIEAALYAYNIAPGLGRNFFLEKLLFISKKDIVTAREFFLQKIDYSYNVCITGSDYDNTLIETAKRNLRRAFNIKNPPDNFSSVKFYTLPAGDTQTFENNGFIVTNPPYGIRLGDTAAAEENYKKMAVFKDRFSGWHIIVLSDHEGFESYFGGKADSCREIICGALKLYLYTFH
ncbi:MAG: class I SAM-dependent RNA methyltransferase [Spirochaetaceae bacterium]|jgi:putative N6-adenine-specific DNA methylase|nr:class I SAM-dependent RNA methyltransferase [Spirochaetaceae bacterium]